MKIYISGAITGVENYMEKFADAEEKLRSIGFDVVNPAKVNAMLPESTTYKQYMDMSLAMLRDCDAIFMLNGFSCSKGAAVEYSYARAIGMIVFFSDAFTTTKISEE
jgi:hypothetical protein